jgi:hypothetical protein
MVNSQAKEAVDVEVQDENNVYLLCRQSAPEGTTVNQAVYLVLLRRLIDAVKRSSEQICVEIAYWFFSAATYRHILSFECRSL